MAFHYIHGSGCTQVCVYFKQFDEAEDLYRQMDRLDLAIGLRSRLGETCKAWRHMQWDLTHAAANLLRWAVFQLLSTSLD